jgi:hypothetical protein
MKLTTVAAVSVLLGTGYAFAGGGAPVPEQPAAGPQAGKPGAVLAESQCKQLWGDAASGESTLSQKDAGPFVVNIAKVDLDSEGRITEQEFLQGCKGGWIQAQASRPAETGGGQTPEQPE